MYIVPGDAGNDVCDYSLARNLILLVVAVTSEIVVQFLLNSERSNRSITVTDLSVNHDE